MVKRWLITGGCGFIGRSLVADLVNEGGHYIRIVDNLRVGSREDLNEICDFKEITPEDLSNQNDMSEGVELLVADIMDADLALKMCRRFEIIVHLAASTGVPQSVESPRMDCENNVIGILNYLEAARHCNVKRFVFASSGAPAGEVEPPIHEELPPHPVSPYGASKLAGEGYCSAYFRTFGVETIALRFGNVYGPGSGNKESVVAKFIRRAMRKEILEIYSDGKQTRDFIYIDDLIRAIRLAATKNGIGGEIFQIAGNLETTVNELVDRLLPILVDSGIKGVEVCHAAVRPGDVKRNFSDTSKAQKLLGWQTSVDLSDGLERTVAWFVRQFNSKKQ